MPENSEKLCVLLALRSQKHLWRQWSVRNKRTLITNKIFKKLLILSESVVCIHMCVERKHRWCSGEGTRSHQCDLCSSPARLGVVYELELLVGSLLCEAYSSGSPVFIPLQNSISILSSNSIFGLSPGMDLTLKKAPFVIAPHCDTTAKT